jgi:regulator of protease activity HflC (stomatin/prohibitin superfamily)
VNGPLVFAIAIALFALILISRTAVRVPQGQAFVVERLGRYDQTLSTGFHILFPGLDAVRFRCPLGEQTVAVPGEECRTRDDRQVWVDATVALKVVDPRRASYDIADYRAGIVQLARTAVRRQVAGVELDQAFASRDAISAGVVRELAKVAETWGVAVLRHEIADISRSKKESAA